MFTEDDLNAVKEAMVGGELEVVIDGKKVRYRSISELREVRRMIEDELKSSAGKRRRYSVNPYFDKGLY